MFSSRTLQHLLMLIQLPLNDKVYLIQSYVIKFVSDLHREVISDLYREVISDLHREVINDLHWEIASDLHRV
jgi:hypothetical protein